MPNSITFAGTEVQLNAPCVLYPLFYSYSKQQFYLIIDGIFSFSFMKTQWYFITIYHKFSAICQQRAFVIIGKYTGISWFLDYCCYVT